MARGDAPFAIVFTTDAATDPGVEIVATFIRQEAPADRLSRGRARAQREERCHSISRLFEVAGYDRVFDDDTPGSPAGGIVRVAIALAVRHVFVDLVDNGGQRGGTGVEVIRRGPGLDGLNIVTRSCNADRCLWGTRLPR